MLPRLTHFKPETVVLQVTTKCPYDCPQCYMKHGNQDMPIAVANGIIDEAVRLGAKAIQITGGEPLVYPNLFQLIEYASNAGLDSFLATSGYSCSDEAYSRLEQSGLTALCISVNGISEALNRKSRIPFEEAICAIQIAHNYHFLCFLNTVVTDDNVDELSLLGKYAKKYGVSGVNILRPVPSNDGIYVPCFSVNAFKKTADTVSQAQSFYNVERCHKTYWEYITSKRFFCRDIGQKMYFVNVDGSFSPCSKMTKYKYRSLLEMLMQYRDWECGCNDTK